MTSFATIILLVSIIGLIIAVIKPSLLERVFKDQKIGRGKAILASTALFVLSFFMFVLSPSDKQPQPVAQTQPVTQSVAETATTKPVASTPTTPQTIEDKLWQAVDTALKQRTNIKVSYDEKEKVAFIEHTDADAYTAESFVKQAYAMFVLFGQEVFKIDGVEHVNAQNKTTFTDQYGKNSIESGVTIEMTKANFSKFDWKNLEYQQVNTRIQAASDIYIIRQALANDIKDQSKLYLKLSYP